MNKRVVAYSLLATINNNSSELKDYKLIFEPLIKKSMIDFYINNINEFLISDLQQKIESLFNLYMPIPVIIKLVQNIADGINVLLTNDDAIIIKKYSSFENDVERYEDSKSDIQFLEIDFQTYLNDNGINEQTSLYDFVDFFTNNIVSLFDSNNSVKFNDDKYFYHAKYLDSIRNDKTKMGIMKKIFWGALVSCFLMEKVENNRIDKGSIFLIDTSFLVSILGFHSESANTICEQVFKLATDSGYKFYIFDLTIEETVNLLLETARTLKSKNFKISEIYSNDITKACFKNPSIQPTDLERTASSLNSIIKKKGIIIEYIDKTKEKVINGKLYKRYKEEFNKDHISAYHDASAIFYVQKCRRKKVIEFEDAKCWFIQDKRNKTNTLRKSDGYLNERVSSHDILIILWLSKPGFVSIDKIGEIELIRSVSVVLEKFSPDRGTLKQFEDNISKYAKDEISEQEYAKLLRRVASKTIDEIEELNDCSYDDFNLKIRQFIEEQENEELIKDLSYEKELILKEEDIELFKTSYENEQKKRKIFEEKIEMYDYKQDELIKVQKRRIERIKAKLFDLKNEKDMLLMRKKKIDDKLRIKIYHFNILQVFITIIYITLYMYLVIVLNYWDKIQRIIPIIPIMPSLISIVINIFSENDTHKFDPVNLFEKYYKKKLLLKFNYSEELLAKIVSQIKDYEDDLIELESISTDLVHKIDMQA